MTQQGFRATFMRGGTSKAVVFRRDDLPADPAEWDAIFLDVMGSPDRNGRQLDGMGGGLSSVSKVCVVGPPTRDDADIDYTFAQIGVRESLVDYSGNCGNMSSAIGPFAVHSGLVAMPKDGQTKVRIHNTNTSRIIIAHFEVRSGQALVDGDMELDGVTGSGSPVRLEFDKPGGGKTGRLLPTGNAVDELDIEGLPKIEASLVDAGNPCVFIAASALGMAATESPDFLEADSEFMDRIERIRCQGSIAMGLAASLDEASKIRAIPKIGIIAAPADYTSLSGEVVHAADHDLLIRMISVGQPHRAIPLTAAVCAAVAARVPASLVQRKAARADAPIRIGHPSGVIVVDAKVTADSEGTAEAVYGAVYRTARMLFDGTVFCRNGRK
jgi:2-methylaconitate cis-trans-isomerase PrpF